MFHALVTGLPAVLIVLMIAAGAAVVVFGVTMLVQRFDGTQGVFVLALLFCLALVGAAAGFSGGFSRSPVVGDIIPAILGLIGGVVLYIFGVAQNKTLLPAFGVVALICAMIAGYSTGANFRGQTDARAADNVDPGQQKAELCVKFVDALASARENAGPGHDALTAAIAEEIRALCARDG